jgi:hypothetical protein
MLPRRSYHQDIGSSEESKPLGEAHIFLLPLLEMHHRLSFSVSLIDAVHTHLRNKDRRLVMLLCYSQCTWRQKLVRRWYFDCDPMYLDIVLSLHIVFPSL